ncbi:YceI family protein [Agriterribacter sp.]|uniref:YceI family protein n=1 Tax=Agriterribacter sp. TaxID=2821509 RepID=UPI002D06D094|nr:YceI family protein [Agriterribacter sp.]HRO45436.1 YceI family protein [Agriterribacter sp.]HRQ19144.1 YceI family protein [Agriterribacter sp.]
MNRIATLIIVLFITNISFGQHFTPTDEGSEIGFKIRNFGVNVSGSFKGLEGKIIFFPDSLSASHFDVTIDVKTINTGINQRDNHLRSEDYFEIAKYPHIHFLSERITTSTNKAYLFVFGKLTIKDITKEISFPFKVTPKDDDYIFEGEFTLNRRDYNVGGGSITMGDNVTLNLKVLAKSDK